MHRVTEQRWTGFFWILLSAALVFQLIAFVSPAWLKIFINFTNYYVPETTTKAKRTTESPESNNVTYLMNSTTGANGTGLINVTSTVPTIIINITTNGKASYDTDLFNVTSNETTAAVTTTSTTTTRKSTTSTKAPLRLPVNQDYSLWYMTQCHVDTWSCDTLTYYHISFMDESYNLMKFKQPNHWFLDRTNLFLDGAELRFDYSTISESQGLFTFGFIVGIVAWWQAYKQRKRLRKKKIENVKNTRLIVAAVAAFFSGLFVLIPVGRFGNMGDRLRMLARDYPNDIAVHKPIGLAFGAIGGTLSLFTGLVIALRLVLRSHCPDCVDVPQQDELAMTERGNQVDGVDKNNADV